MTRKYRLISEKKNKQKKPPREEFYNPSVVDPTDWGDDEDEVTDNFITVNSFDRNNAEHVNNVLKRYTSDEDEDYEGGDSGTGTLKPDEASILVVETDTMVAEQREIIQRGNRAHAKVNLRHMPERDPQAGNEAGDYLEAHPLLKQTQQLDGIDRSLAADPRNSEEARVEFENQLRHQHQKRMEKQAQLSSAPTMRAQ